MHNHARAHSQIRRGTLRLTQAHLRDNMHRLTSMRVRSCRYVSMCACVHLCMCVCKCESWYARICACMHACMCTHACIQVIMCVYIYIYIYMCVCTCMCSLARACVYIRRYVHTNVPYVCMDALCMYVDTHVNKRIHVRVRTFTHIYICIYKYTYTYTYICSSQKR